MAIADENSIVTTSIYRKLVGEEEFIVVCKKCQKHIDVRTADSDGWFYYCKDGCDPERLKNKKD